jgi:hypothetical protein
MGRSEPTDCLTDEFYYDFINLYLLEFKRIGYITKVLSWIF